MCFRQRGRDAREPREHALTDKRSLSFSARKSMTISSISRGRIDEEDMAEGIGVRKVRCHGMQNGLDK